MSTMIQKIISHVYYVIFHENINTDIFTFLNKLSYVSIGLMLEALIVFAFNVLGGRILGPVEYGKYTLIYSFAMFLYVPMLFGIANSMVKHNAEKKIYDRQKTIISTSYIIVLSLSILCSTFLLLISSHASFYLDIPINYFYLAVIFAFLFTMYTLTTNTFRSLNEMKTFTKLRFFTSFCFIVSFLFLASSYNISFKVMIFSTYAGYLIEILIALFFLKKYLSLSFDIQWAKVLLKYGSLILVSNLSVIFYTNIDKILINKYMQVSDVGIYSAYILSSIKIMGIFTGIFIAVLFPSISKNKNKKNILLKIRNLVPYLFTIGVPCMIMSQYIILTFYGKSYPINYSLMVLFALTAILFALFDIYMWIFNSIGMEGAKISLYGSISIAFADILLNIYLIPVFGLHGAIFATAVSYCIGMTIMQKKWKSLKKNTIIT